MHSWWEHTEVGLEHLMGEGNTQSKARTPHGWWGHTKLGKDTLKVAGTHESRQEHLMGVGTHKGGLKQSKTPGWTGTELGIMARKFLCWSIKQIKEDNGQLNEPGSTF